MTYATLKADVAAWLDRTDLTAQIPSFIRLTEARIARDVRVGQLTSAATLTILAGSSSVALPSDYAEGRSAQAQGGFRFVTPEKLQQIKQAGSGDSVYSIYSGSVQIPFNAVSAVSVSLVYYSKPDAMTADADTNWLLENHPAIYLFGTLSEAAIFLADDQRAALFEAKYQGGLTGLRVNDAGINLFSADLPASYVV